MTGCRLLRGKEWTDIDVAIRRRISRIDDKLIFAVGNIAFEIDTEPLKELLESDEERMIAL